MAKTKLSHRAFALTMAILFLFTAVATGAAVIYSVYSANKTSNSANNPKTAANATHLAGTKLAGFTPVSNVSSLQASDIKVGTGPAASASSTISVLYTGAVAATGTIFQASSDSGPSPVTLSLSNVITGWQKGIPGMKVGGERQLLIPANEAYGPNPPAGSNIPPNAPLVFDITLLNVK